MGRFQEVIFFVFIQSSFHENCKKAHEIHSQKRKMEPSLLLNLLRTNFQEMNTNFQEMNFPGEWLVGDKSNPNVLEKHI